MHDPLFDNKAKPLDLIVSFNTENSVLRYHVITYDLLNFDPKYLMSKGKVWAKISVLELVSKFLGLGISHSELARADIFQARHEKSTARLKISSILDKNVSGSRGVRVKSDLKTSGTRNGIYGVEML